MPSSSFAPGAVVMVTVLIINEFQSQENSTIPVLQGHGELIVTV